MQQKLFTMLLLAGTLFSFGQDSCTLGTISDTSANGENISTGGEFEYGGAADFDVPFGTTFTTNQITLNLLKGDADIQYVNVTFSREQNGLPGTVIQTFDGLVPTSQTLVYAIEDSELDTYQIALELPSTLILEKGKYFIEVAAAAGDQNNAWWEITSQEQRYGVFDYFRFGNEPWGGTGYYNKVFQILGNCTDSGETQPEYGDVCSQGNASNDYENGAPFLTAGQLVSIADDFTVAENTVFHLTDFTMHSLLLGGGLHNATIKIRSSVEGIPGEVLHSFEQKGPDYEEYQGYHPFPGLLLEAVAVNINFSFANTPIELQPGNYFVEVTPTPFATDFLTWETTTLPGIGEFSYTSYDGGESWNLNDGANQVFTVGGFCSPLLGTNDPKTVSGIQYFPNPVKNVLQIRAEKQISSIRIYNIEGREVNGYKSGNNNINMEALASGIYIVKAQFENGSSKVFKVIKE